MNKPTVAALIPAAGSGTRLGLGPKAFVEVHGSSLLARSIQALAPYIDELLVAIPPQLINDSSAWGDLPQLNIPQQFIQGGNTRQQSVLALLEACTADIVIIHDAARPFVQPEVIQALLDATQKYGAATSALPVADTLVKADTQNENEWGSICPRDGLWAVQTPQVFKRALLIEAHQQAIADGFIATDDAGVVARTGHKVHLIKGDARMFKVTTPSDLALAEALAQSNVATALQDSTPTQKTLTNQPRASVQPKNRYFAPAKINLGLSVLGIRDDGYHELHSLMAPLSISDTLDIEPAEQLSLEVKGADLPTNQENLVYRAAQSYLTAAGQQTGVKITLHKHLPLASGLGGGSSDAATTLLALSQLYPAQVDLPVLALKLGADVPFFLLQQAALAKGVGEQLTPLELPPTWLVLANPKIEVSARDAYQWLDATGNFTAPLDTQMICQALLGHQTIPYFNTLQTPVLAQHPEIQEVLNMLTETGLHSPLMSGSGSTCFALASDKAHAHKAVKTLTQQHAHWWVQPAQILSHSSEFQQPPRILC